MPVQYTGILQEARIVRSAAGLFDVSHMGQVVVSGPGALSAVQRLLTNDASKLAPGRAQYSLMCRDDGGILDDLIVYRWDDGTAEPEFLIVVNASNREQDFGWMSSRGSGDDVTWRDASDDYALIALQGPNSQDLLAPFVSGTDLAGLRYFSHTKAEFRALTKRTAVHIARTGYTGEDGFELFCTPDDSPEIWVTLANAGAGPCGLGARDVLRIEASYPLYGHEIDTTTNPYEAGLGWVVKPAKGDFVGRDAMLSARESGITRVLRGVVPVDERAVPRQDTVITFADGREGRVTSGTMSPTLNRAIGICYVPSHSPESALLEMRGKQLPASITSLPFYKR